MSEFQQKPLFFFCDQKHDIVDARRFFQKSLLENVHTIEPNLKESFNQKKIKYHAVITCTSHAKESN